MNQLIYKLLEEMKASLEQVSSSSEHILQRAQQSYEVVKDSLRKLREHVAAHEFTSKEEEIHFFKVVKPMFLRELIFFMELYSLELNLPIGSIEEKKSFLLKAQQNIGSFFERNKVLYAYYRTGKTMYDELFFLREGNCEALPMIPEYALDTDVGFSTLNSFCLAKLQAYEQLNEYIQSMLYRFTHPELDTFAQDKQQNLWTDSNAALIELAYAIHARGSVNHGKGDIKSVIASLERIFNVQVGNFYRAMQNMRIRKKSRTPYLDGLKESLEKKMDDTDLNFL